MKKKQRVCVILPVLSNLNSILYVFTELIKMGNEVIVITSKRVGTKGVGTLPEIELINDLKIYRIADNYTSSKYFLDKISEISLIVDDFNPTIIFFGTRKLYKISKQISNRSKAKLVFLTEFFINSRRFIGERRYYMGIPVLAKPIASLMRSFFLRRVDKIIVTDFTEEAAILRRYKSKKIAVMPWCNHLPSGFEVKNIGIESRLDQAIFAGSLINITINRQFLESVQSLIENKIVNKVVIVGQGPLKYKLEDLESRYPGKIILMGTLPRKKALQEIGQSKLAILTTVNGGWGFIGECFALGTPLLYVYNHYSFNHLIDSFKFSYNTEEGVRELFGLISNDKKYRELQSNMMQRYISKHSSQSVALKVSDIFDSI